MAMEIANKLAQKNGKIRFHSAGIAVMGLEADNMAKQALAHEGIVTEHAPTSIEALNISIYDEIHVMTPRQKTALCKYFKGADLGEKIRVLDIEDPYGKGENAYYDCLYRLKEFYEKFVNG
jgi:protein-tyrosine-phosphatase